MKDYVATYWKNYAIKAMGALCLLGFGIAYLILSVISVFKYVIIYAVVGICALFSLILLLNGYFNPFDYWPEILVGTIFVMYPRIEVFLFQAVDRGVKISIEYMMRSVHSC